MSAPASVPSSGTGCRRYRGACCSSPTGPCGSACKPCDPLHRSHIEILPGSLDGPPRRSWSLRCGCGHAGILRRPVPDGNDEKLRVACHGPSVADPSLTMSRLWRNHAVWDGSRRRCVGRLKLEGIQKMPSFVGSRNRGVAREASPITAARPRLRRERSRGS